MVQLHAVCCVVAVLASCRIWKQMIESVEQAMSTRKEKEENRKERGRQSVLQPISSNSVSVPSLEPQPAQPSFSTAVCRAHAPFASLNYRPLVGGRGGRVEGGGVPSVLVLVRCVM